MGAATERGLNTMIAPELPQSGYTIREASRLCGFKAEKYLYRLAHEGKATFYRDCTNQLRISREEVYRLIHERLNA